MSKKIFQIVSLVLSVLGLVYMILVRYGIIRYVKLHFSSTEGYIDNFKTLPKADKSRVVITFSADTSQMKKLKPFINSILDQTVRVDDIALNIPYKDVKSIPENLKKILSVHGYSKDYDDAGNLVCSVLTEPEANTKIIVVEPNMVYGEDFVEEMVRKSNENNNKIVYGGKDKNPKWGMLIQPDFFDDKISEYEKGTGCCNWLNKCCSVEGVHANYSNTYKSWL